MRRLEKLKSRFLVSHTESYKVIVYKGFSPTLIY